MAAECFPVGEYIREELEARGWDASDLAARIVAKRHIDELNVEVLAIEMLIACSGEPGVRIGEMANSVADAFGVSPELFLNLEKAYLKHREKP